MRLSEAIRLGAMLKPQGYEFLLHKGHTCALGAAADAGGIALREPQMFPCNEMRRRWPLLAAYENASCPVCAAVFCGVVASIVHLNDGHRWTRERIADWVETVEERDNERSESATATNAVREETGEPVLSIRGSSSSFNASPPGRARETAE